MNPHISKQNNNGNVKLILTIFVPLACGYFLSFFYRSINAMIAPSLVNTFGLTPSELGLMTAVYFLGFGLFQLPLGVLLDRFGPARVQSSLLAVAAVGAALFSASERFDLLIAGRGLIGIGVAGALMSSFTAFALWFPKNTLPLANGCFMGIGGIGALAATKPVEWMLTITDWRGLFLLLSITTATVALFIRVSLPDTRNTSTPINLRAQILDLKEIYSNKFFWRIAPLTISTVATGFAIQGLWAAAWLRDVANLKPEGVANHLLLMAFGIILGPIATGVIAEAARRRNISLLGLYGTMAAIFMVLQVLIIFAWTQISFLLWTGFGFFINAMSLSYAILTQTFPRKLAGRLNTNLNMMMISAAFLAQYLVGWVIEFWPFSLAEGYHPQAYRFGFGLLLSIQFFSLVWFAIQPIIFFKKI